MTTKKSVVEIDIQDSKWKTFVAEFAKFGVDSKKIAEDLAAGANMGAKVSAEKKKILDTQAKQAKLTKEERTEKEAAVKAEAKVYEAERKKYAAQSKAADERKKQRADDMKALRDSAKWTADVARNLASTALSAAKWATFSAIASGFGLGGLGASASTVRRTSQGLGIKAGELRAANVNFGKYIDPEAALGNIAGAQSDLSKRWIFNALGENPAGKDAAQILPEILPKLVQAFKAGGSTLQGAQARGLDQIVGIDDLRRLSVLTEEELSKTIDAYKKDRQALEEGDSTGRAWQDFMVSLHRAGDQIEVSLLKGLTKLTPYLEAFANGIAKAIDSFVSNGGLQEWIEKVGAALERLGNYLGSKEFSTDVESFMGAVHTMAAFLGKLFPKSAAEREVAAGTASTMPAPGAAPSTYMDKLRASGRVYGAIWDHIAGNVPLSVRNHNPGNLRIPGSATGFQSFQNDDQGIAALSRQLTLYEQRDHLTTIRGILNKYSPGNENDTQALIANASKRTGFGPDQQLDPKSLDQLVKLVVAITKQENGSSSFTENGVRLVIENQTGGSAQATVAGLAH